MRTLSFLRPTLRTPKTFLRTFLPPPNTPPSPSPAQPAIHETSLQLAQHTLSSIDHLSHFLISQPLQPLSHTTAVILTTILVRSTTTLPISIWSRLRINRFERIVLPSFKAFRTNLALRAKRSFLDPAQIPTYQAHLQTQLKRELDRLILVNRCQPWLTILGSLGIHVPVIYGLTTVLRTACEQVSPGSPLAIEPSPILGASLLEPDLALAVLCWAAFLVNIELNASFRYLRRSVSSNASSSSSRQLSKNASFINRGLSFWSPEKIRSASFLAGVGMMGISSSQPALVLIYWLTSNCFSIVQSLCFIYLDHRHNSRVKAQPSIAHPSSPVSSSSRHHQPATASTLLHSRPNHLGTPRPQKPHQSSLPPIL